MDAEATRIATEAVPSIPTGPDGLVFREPWEAQSFAMTLVLHEKGVFTWPEWVETLVGEIKRAQENGDPDRGDTYYSHWLAALERIISEKGVSDDLTITSHQVAWGRAVDRTPHGEPILLEPRDFQP